MPFATYPSAVVYKTPGKKMKRNAVQHLIWGDWLKRLGPTQDEWVKVRARRENGWMHKDDIQKKRILEVNFVDIGQGDGCFIVWRGAGAFLVTLTRINEIFVCLLP